LCDSSEKLLDRSITPPFFIVEQFPERAAGPEHAV
jgi:hypothetical protein